MPEARVPRALRVLSGALLGATLGVVEAAVRIGADGDPSVLRRAWAIAGQAAVLYGATGGGVAALDLLLRGLGRTRPWRATFWGAALVFCVLLLVAGPWLSQLDAAPRALALVAGVGLASVLSLAATRLSPGLAGGRRARPGRASLGLAAALLVVSCLGLAYLHRSRPRFASPEADPTAPHVVLVVVDTLRADVLGCYGDGGGLTPNMDALASRGAVFGNVLAPAPWTLPSVASILSGHYPRQHGMTDFDRTLSPDSPSLPEAFLRAGYHTRASIGNPLVNDQRGLARGFEVFDRYYGQVQSDLWLSRLVAEVLRLRGPLRHLSRHTRPYPVLSSEPPWVEVRIHPAVDDFALGPRLLGAEPLPEERPLFLYVHYTAPHAPYVDHVGLAKTTWPGFSPEHRDTLWKLYRREVAYTDEALGHLLGALDEAGLLGRAIVVVTSDHGEEFLEHGGTGHGENGLYREVVRVPLVVAGPGIPAGLRLDAPVSLVDLAPTLLDLSGLPAPHGSAGGFAGRSLGPDLRGEEAPADRTLFTEVESVFLDPEEDAFGLLLDRWKVLHRVDASGALLAREVFDLKSDPQELRSLADVPPGLEPRLEELRAYATRGPPSRSVELVEDELEQLRALGYGR